MTSSSEDSGLPGEIIVRLDVMLALRKRRAKAVAAEIGMTEANLSLLKSGKVKGVRFDTLIRLCDALTCTPGELLEYVPNKADDAG
ncbi:transcriptional regulator [Henriciella barbarensis]|uniref:Transcriptional regulator n=1 Tax=Henriciella barbarensis TaxID=86342 RepID=A0A399QWZ8_9PROT|nr:helix-turn-helix transcriptional regulator [Henriciella barbarensis]RIJ23616.1 transcriptional regulator [Henriciella barbarensis]